MASFDLSSTFNHNHEESLNIHLLTDSQVFSFIHELSSQTSDVSPKILFSTQQKARAKNIRYLPQSGRDSSSRTATKNLNRITELLSKEEVY